MQIIGRLNGQPVKAYRPISIRGISYIEYQLDGDTCPYTWRRVTLEVWRHEYLACHTGKTRAVGNGERYVDDGEFMKIF